MSERGARRSVTAPPQPLARRFEGIVFDWDGTAVPDRGSDASPVRALVEALTGLGVHLVIVSGTHVGNVDGQLGARPSGPGRLYLCLNRGSEAFRVGLAGPRVTRRRLATSQENAALDAAAELAVRRFSDRGLEVRVVSSRLNRRKIDLIPLPGWEDPPKAHIDALLAAVEGRLADAAIGGLPEAVAIGLDAAAAAGLLGARVTSDVKHVEIGLTDKSDSARWAFAELWRLGVGPAQVLVAGDEMGLLGGVPGSDSLMLAGPGATATVVSVGVEPAGVPPRVVHLGGGPNAFLGVLRDQVRLRREGAAHEPAAEPGWMLEVDGVDPEHEPLREARLTLSDGVIGTRGAALGTPGEVPGVLVAGVYRGEGPDSDLVAGPAWAWLPDGRSSRRELDLHAGTLYETVGRPNGTLRTVRFSSLVRPGLAALRVDGAVPPDGGPLLSPEGEVEAERIPGGFWARVRADGGGIAAAVMDDRGAASLDRFAAYAGSPRRLPSIKTVLMRVSLGRQAGFDRILLEHREAWARRWDEAGVILEGDDELQLAIRFAQFHLMGSVGDRGEAAVGSRGLSGPAYRGHVFWDADVFVLPFLAATHPAAARAMLEYRIRRLPEARAAAARLHRAGARFPWESAATGEDVTPGSARDRSGRLVAIRTGDLEEHVVADVAWAAACYADWTGDEGFLRGPGGLLLAETARYWASRIRLDGDDRGHIYGVIGPDEYHEPVDDNAFTNVMARWNLRRAARDGGSHAGEAERRRWLDLAERIVDGYEVSTALYEQFTGFFDLEPLVIAEFSDRPVAADLLLGPERTESSQVVKQADVLMLHHLVPEEVAPRSLAPNLEFYEPRTAHGSSLSPGVHAALFARAGRLDEAVSSLRTAALLDAEDLAGTTAGGLHLAAMGGVWQALAFGFAGTRPSGETLLLDPRLPQGWEVLEVPLRFRGSPIRVRIEPGTVSIRIERPVRVSLGGAPAVTLTPPVVWFRRSNEGWEEDRT